MKKEETPTTRQYKLPHYRSDIGKKGIDVFTKIKADEIDAPRELAPLESDLKELSEFAMNSYRPRSEVVKAENGFDVVLTRDGQL